MVAVLDTPKLNSQELLDAALLLPVETRQVFAEVLWESLDHQSIPLTSEEILMLKEARADLDAYPDTGIPLATVLTEVEALYP